MTSLFLSYARGDDEPFVKRLYQDLVDKGFDVWWDRESMPSRPLPFPEEIRDAIYDSDRLLLVIGPHAVRDSECIRTEIGHVRDILHESIWYLNRKLRFYLHLFLLKKFERDITGFSMPSPRPASCHL